MATKYHISPKTGAPAPCTASLRACPVGGPDEHYSSPDEARSAFEMSQASNVLPRARKRSQVSPAQQVALQEQLSGGVLTSTVRATTSRLAEAYSRLGASPRWRNVLAEKTAFFRADISENEPRPPLDEILAGRGISF